MSNKQSRYFSSRPFAALCALPLPSAWVHVCDLSCGADNTYPRRTQTVRVERRTTKPNLSAGLDEVLLNGQELAIYITDEGEMERCFMDARHRAADVQVDGDVSIDFALQDLVEHFLIPEVPDEAECNPTTFDEHLRRLNELEQLINSLL